MPDGFLAGGVGRRRCKLNGCTIAADYLGESPQSPLVRLQNILINNNVLASKLKGRAFDSTNVVGVPAIREISIKKLVASRGPRNVGRSEASPRRSKRCRCAHASSTGRRSSATAAVLPCSTSSARTRATPSRCSARSTCFEVNGEDIKREPIEDRRRRLAGLLRLPHDGIALNETFTGEGATIYKHACALGCEGIVSKRLGSPGRVGRSPHWRRRPLNAKPKKTGVDRVAGEQPPDR